MTASFSGAAFSVFTAGPQADKLARAAPSTKPLIPPRMLIIMIPYDSFPRRSRRSIPICRVKPCPSPGSNCFPMMEGMGVSRIPSSLSTPRQQFQSELLTAGPAADPSRNACGPAVRPLYWLPVAWRPRPGGGGKSSTGEKIIETPEKVALIRDALDAKKGIDIQALEVGELTSVTDFFVLATGSNPPHLKALAEETERCLKQAGEPCHRRAGQPDSGWIVLDFLDVVLHLFEKTVRSHYDLEGLWSDAPRVDPPTPRTP